MPNLESRRPWLAIAAMALLRFVDIGCRKALQFAAGGLEQEREEIKEVLFEGDISLAQLRPGVRGA